MNIFRDYLKAFASLIIVLAMINLLMTLKEIKHRQTRIIFQNFTSSKDCKHKDYTFEEIRREQFWLLKNYVKSNDPKECHESITYTTHSDFTFLENLVPLLERWEAPISIALYAPGEDFNRTLSAIAFLRHCHQQRSLVQQLVTFHIFCEEQFKPKTIPYNFTVFEESFDCVSSGELINFPRNRTFKAMNNLTYPINIGRNLARQSALTHFVLPSDIELYPSPGLVQDFLDMIRGDPVKYLNGRNVFVLPIFEIDELQQMPANKSELVSLFHQGTVIWFHYRICPICHAIPNAEKWLETPEEREMEVFITVKRKGAQFHWEPIYIGTNAEPLYDERLSWEGKSDKMTQAYIMCLLDYKFNVLSNGFLVHRSGIKTEKEAARTLLEEMNNKLIRHLILSEITAAYGITEGCKILE